MKYYTADTGLRWHVNGNRTGDSGRLLENVVYLELLRRSRHVYAVQTKSGREVDFVTRDGDDVAYYQVAENVSDDATLARELAALRDVGDEYPKFLITADWGLPASHNGIRQIGITDFLLSRRQYSMKFGDQSKGIADRARKSLCSGDAAVESDFVAHGFARVVYENGAARSLIALISESERPIWRIRPD